MKISIHLIPFILFTFLLSCGKADRQKEVTLANEAPTKPVHYDKNYACAEVKKMASESLSIALDSIRRDSKLVDLGISESVDDIRYMELLMHVEATFEIEIPDYQAEKFKTIGELCDYIEDRTK